MIQMVIDHTFISTHTHTHTQKGHEYLSSVHICVVKGKSLHRLLN